MRAEDVKRLEKEVEELYTRFESFRLVAETLGIKTADVIHLLKDTEEGKVEYFSNREYEDFPMFNFR